MTLENFNADDMNASVSETRSNKRKLNLVKLEGSLEIEADEIINVVKEENISQRTSNICELEVSELTHEPGTKDDTISIDNDSDCSSIDSSDNSDLNYSTCSEDNIGENDSVSSWEDASSEGTTSSIDEDAIANLNEFPVQMICLEKCEGTLDDLFIKELIDEKNCSSILFQIIMTLIPIFISSLFLNLIILLSQKKF